MSTTPNPEQPTKVVVTDDQQIMIVSHSTLFYWWPVWAIGFVLAGLTWFDNHRVGIVPTGTTVVKGARLEIEGKAVLRDALVAPEGEHLPAEQPFVHLAISKNYGVLYALVLLLVIVITNVPLRGLWSVIVLIVIIMTSVIFAVAGWWERILLTLDKLQIYINGGGYFTISLVLFVVWLVTFWFFDRQIYMVFTPRQLRVRQEIGGGEKAYDTTGMMLEKQRNDLFRHWILGLGSGDLIVNTSGSTAHHFDLPNVLWVGHKVKQIEEMLREVPVVRG